MKPKPKCITTPRPSLVRAFKTRDEQVLQRLFRKALKKRNRCEQLNEINILLASSLQGYIELRNLPMPADKTLATLWNVVREHLTLDPNPLMNCMRPTIEGLAQGLTHAVDGLSLTTELNFTGTIVTASPSDDLASGYLHIPLFAHAAFALILVLHELDAYCLPF